MQNDRDGIMDKKDLRPVLVDGRTEGLAPGVSRRSFFMAAGAAGLGAAAQVIGARPAEAQSTAWLQPGNNNHVIGLQGETGQPGEGAVGLDFYGHCALRITSPKGASVLFDPWRDDPSGAWGMWFKNEFPETVVDICMSTHAHFDHDAVDRPHSTMVLDRMVGRFDFADLSITGFADKHTCVAPGWYHWTDALAEFGVDACPPNNVGHMDNVAFLVETGGIRTLIWGDNRHNPSDAFWQAVGRVDVLTLPVDGSEHILSFEQGNEIVARLKPRIVIPTHYLNETTSYTLTTLQVADDWVRSQQNHRFLDGPSLSLEAAEIAGMEQEFHYFGHHAMTA
jgi:L-ascorbate metabolism protein UlaG (beta-lactamase superfamily)